jgi:hypothetical protein
MPETPGKVKQIAGTARLYIKPALGKVIIRKSGVNRMSAAVIERNTKFREWAGGKTGAVVSCRGKPWREFISCLKDSASKAKLGEGKAKTREYRKKFWKHPA